MLPPARRRLGANRLLDRGLHKPLDVGTGGVVGAKLGRSLRVERALEQRAEDRRLDVAPVASRRGGSSAKVPLVRGSDDRVGEEAAVEARVCPRTEGTPLIHRAPRGAATPPGNVFGLRDPLASFEPSVKIRFGKQSDVLSEHGEEAAHEKLRHELLGVSRPLRVAWPVRRGEQRPHASPSQCVSMDRGSADREDGADEVLTCVARSTRTFARTVRLGTARYSRIRRSRIESNSSRCSNHKEGRRLVRVRA